MSCTTHHYACECREKKFNEALKIAVEALENIDNTSDCKFALEIVDEALTKIRELMGGEVKDKEQKIATQAEADNFIEKAHPEIREHWCNPIMGCCCNGCVNISGGGEMAGLKIEQWEDWMKRNAKAPR